MPSFKIAIVKTIFWLPGFLRIGAGGTWPGHIILKIYPRFLHKYLDNFSKHLIYVSGTNGKTTTSFVLCSSLGFLGTPVVSNLSGANLLNGIASCVLKAASLFGNLSTKSAVFEVDEAVLKKLISIKSPTHLILLNLSRDQLDRYGEVDITLEKWSEALGSAQNTVRVFYFSSNKYLLKLKKLVLNSNITFIPFGKTNDFVKTSLIGSYNQINVNAVSSILLDLGYKKRDIMNVLSLQKHAFGRGESFLVNGITATTLLAKNPASFNNNLKLLILIKTEYNVLFVLNDNIPDGKDVSWIYDIKSSLLKKVCSCAKNVYVSGSRAFDFALRLKIAGVNTNSLVVSKNLNLIIKKAILCKENLYIFPTYSAMLKTRKILIGRKIF